MTIATYKNKVIPVFTLFLFISAIGAYLSQFLSPQSQRVALIVWFVLLIISIFVRFLGKKIGAIVMTVFVVCTGIILGPGINYIANTNGGETLIAEALGITAIAFIVLSLVAIKADGQYLSWGRYLFVGLIIALLVAFINIFLLSNVLEAIVSSIILIIFLGFVLFDTENILKNYGDDEYFYGALTLYFDFVNIFVRVLDFLNSIKQ